MAATALYWSSAIESLPWNMRTLVGLADSLVAVGDVGVAESVDIYDHAHHDHRYDDGGPHHQLAGFGLVFDLRFFGGQFLSGATGLVGFFCCH